MDTITEVLKRRHPRVSSDVIAGWTAVEPALAGATSSSDLIARCHRDGNTTMAALLRTAARDRAAAEVVLAALAPGLARLARRFSPKQPRDRDEVAARVAAAAWTTILGLAGTSAPWPTTAILDRVRDTIRADARADRRRLGSCAAMAALPELPFIPDEPRTDWDEMLHAAVRAGQLTTADARLVWTTRVDGFSLADVARATGQRHDGLRRRRARAERALRAAA